MKQWLTVALAWIVSLFTFWKLGERDGSRTEQAKKESSRSDSVARGISAGESARSKWLSEHK